MDASGHLLLQDFGVVDVLVVDSLFLCVAHLVLQVLDLFRNGFSDGEIV